MTAINPARLKIQCAQVGGYFHEPVKFVSELHDLLGFYGARIRQTTLNRTPLTLQAYQVPAPVIRALELELREYLGSSPDQAFDLVDRLWEEEWVEFRQLATILLGNIPPHNPPTILERIDSWLGSCTAEELRRMILERGLKRLIIEEPKQALEYINQLAERPEKEDRQAALYGLMVLVQGPGFSNLPLVFKILEGILRVDETGLVKEISQLIRSLQKKSDQETAFFLIRQLSSASKPRIFRVIRAVLPSFSKDNQKQLKQNLQNFS